MIVHLFVVLLIGTAINDYNAGGTKSLSEAKNNIVEILKNPEPLDYSKMNR
jgi:hypothetical protein